MSKNRNPRKQVRQKDSTGNTQEIADTSSRSGPSLRWLVLLLSVTFIAVAAYLALRQLSDDGKGQVDLLQKAKRELRLGNFPDAERTAVQATQQQNGNTGEAWLVAAQAASGAGKREQTLDYCQNAVEFADQLKGPSLRAAGELSFHAQSLELSQQFYALAMQKDPSDLEAQQRTLYLLGLSGRLWDAVPILRTMVDSNQSNYQTLILLGDHYRFVNFKDVLTPMETANPSDWQVLLGLGRIELANLRPRQALEYFRRAETLNSTNEELQASLGEALFEIQDFRALATWKAKLGEVHRGANQPGETQLSDKVISHPCVWRVLGKWAQQRNRTELAASCFAKAVLLDPDDMESTFKLAEILSGLGESKTAQQLLERHRLLDRLVRRIVAMYGGNPKAEDMLDVAELCGELGREKEQYAWLSLVASGSGRPSESQRRAAIDRLTKLTSDGIRPAGLAWNSTLSKLQIPRDLGAGDWVAMDLSSVDLDSKELASSAVDRSSQQQLSHEVAWRDVAQQVGLKFNYFASPTNGAEGRRIYEFGGGGVGALDYDGDGYADLAFTQGCDWPPPGISSNTPVVSNEPHVQKLFRNRSGVDFVDVASLARVDHVRFGQGIACGDIDNDGFQDIYIGCIGPNLLLRNNGDGTFTDVTVEMGLGVATAMGSEAASKEPTRANQWTTSCAIADVNGDGLADLYDVNYLSGRDLYDRICTWEGGRKRICGPGTFDAADDCLWLNNGQSFRDASLEAGILVPDGKGLGIVIGDLMGLRRNCIFVANDQTANFFFVPAEESASSKQEGLPTKFTEEAEMRGLAYDESGAKQGCMGVAVGDFNQDDLLDLFVTNYVTESNTLYQQMQPGQFADRTRSANLREASIPMVGFGTQSVDARLSGELDLVVVNGHLDDFAFKSQAFEMPTQYFQNGSGRFTEITESLGGYFRGRYRGRGMARLDWNNDGLDDLAISHLDSPAALLENHTREVGAYFCIELCGTTSSRDAVGATVQLQIGENRRTQTLTAGDGYQSSNQHRLVFGLGSAKLIDHVHVVWPIGKTELHHQLTPGKWIAIEGIGLFRKP